MEWQPIETAPKDEAEILVWSESLGYFVVLWEDKMPNTNFNWVTAEGFVYHKEAFSHWMRLPDQPFKE